MLQRPWQACVDLPVRISALWKVHQSEASEDFIEFQTNECVSDDKETMNRSTQNRVQMFLKLQ